MTYLKALKLYPKDEIKRKEYIKNTFVRTICSLPYIISTPELDIKKQSLTYVFEHIKDALVDIIAMFAEPDDGNILKTKKWNDFGYRKKLFDVLLTFEYKPIMIWIFLHFNYFKIDNLEMQRKQLLENIDMFSKYLPYSHYFKNISELLQENSLNPLFSISYQNRNNKQILESYSKMLRKICPDLNYNGVKENRKKNPLPKICFFSEYLTTESSVLRDRIGIISQLPKNKFDVYYMSFTSPEKITGHISKTLYNLLKDKYLQAPNNICDARSFIADQNFDIIIYCELGMLMKPLYLSYARLAPVQITTWGHSETSGIDTIDYYVSSKYFEIDEVSAQNHYSEKLILMNSLSTYYYTPTKLLLPLNHEFKTRKDFNYDDKMNIYGCIQSSFKISEEFEKIIANIIKGDPNARILMSLNKPFCRSQIIRIKNLLGDNDFKKLFFLPSLDIITYMNLIKLSDVIIDPYPFGGCNTSMEAFDFNIPVVTMPTKFINGRFTFGMYKKMGFIDMVADSVETYVRIAIKAGTDKKWRETIVDKIKKNKHLLFQEKASVIDWSNFLETVYEHKLF